MKKQAYKYKGFPGKFKIRKDFGKIDAQKSNMQKKSMQKKTYWVYTIFCM